ncbi:hypothetical protein [Paraglaciecola hydrolytica]|uniref:hypothetical protein n=1 Tax=Paraglaciecola hydrolytica TaxID=1799789 RepID=UPI0012FEEB5E|nr:hypothetical protein [Paraglaciecola hydrolytica]
MQKIKQCLTTFPYLLLLPICLGACTAHTNGNLQSEQLQLQWQKIVNEPITPTPPLTNLLNEALRQQNWLIVWHSALLLCQVETQQERKKMACQRAQYAVELLPDQGERHFQTELIYYLQFQDATSLKRAETFAFTPQQITAVQLAKGEIPPQAQQRSIAEGSLQQAQLLYLLGKQQADLRKLEQAALLFHQHKQRHKIADCYFLMAQLYYATGDKPMARQFAAQSLLLLDGLQSHEAHQHVSEWFNVWLSAR